MITKIPPYDELTAPILQFLAEQKTATRPEIKEKMASVLKLSEAEQSMLLPSGKQTVLASRLSWAISDLCRAGLLARPKRGVYVITQTGLSLAKAPPPAINRKFLMANYPIFAKSMEKSMEASDTGVSKSKIKAQARIDISGETPEEIMEGAASDMHRSLKDELKLQIDAMSPTSFEYLCRDLIKSMGYGGTRNNVIAEVTPRSRDGGIDGFVSEDRLGLNMIYIQAKHYAKNKVSRPDLQRFAGAMDKHFEKGVFITTFDFSKDAIEFTKKSARKIVLINGDRLADLMIEYNIGVSVSYTYEIKKIDSDYFDRE